MDTAAEPIVIHARSTMHIHSVAQSAEKSLDVVIIVLKFVISASAALPVGSLATSLVAMVAVHDHVARYAIHASNRATGQLIVLTKAHVP